MKKRKYWKRRYFDSKNEIFLGINSSNTREPIQITETHFLKTRNRLTDRKKTPSFTWIGKLKTKNPQSPQLIYECFKISVKIGLGPCFQP